MKKKAIRKLSSLMAVAVILLTLGAPGGQCEEASALQSEYKMPPQPIADLADAPFTPSVSVSPDREWMLIRYYPGLSPIEEVAQPELRLAGIRINPRTNGPSRDWYYNRLVLKKIGKNEETEITGLPESPHITDAGWSPDSKRVSFILSSDNRLELWTASVSDGRASRIFDKPLNGAYIDPFEWFPDSKKLVVLAIPDGRGDPPREPLVPAGPVIQENIQGEAPARTYQDLLKNAFDEELFDFYTTSRVYILDLDGDFKPVAEPGIIAGMEPSPDGNYLLLETIHRPYSYTVPIYRFPHRVEIWDRLGRPVTEVADLPLADNIPIAFGSVQAGPRGHGWREDSDAALYWVEAVDGGDASRDADFRDQLYMLPEPFDGKPVPLAKLPLRFGGVQWGDDDLALVSTWWWKTRVRRTWRIRPGHPEKGPELVFDLSWEDRYNDPGVPVTQQTRKGTRRLVTADGGRHIFLIGDGASPEGDRPFLDEFNLETLDSKRLFRSEAPYYERPAGFIDVGKKRILTSRESINEPPNYFIRDLKENTIVQLTDFPHPTPQLVGVYKEMIRYKRGDGVDLTATLYLPPGKKPENGPFPMLMWAYPQEFKSADAAGQVTDSPYRFVRISRHSPLFFLVEGYAILDDPTMPIIGEGDAEPNDTFVKQLAASAEAAVETVVAMGVADRDRIAIGGHSYGAFMAANLLAHTDLFRLGIARSGAYNRTLTPFGFQSEERTLWQAPQVYFTMSPFMHADKINEPILLIHGQADNNSGTFPMQSERFYDALKGLGATARLVMLPSESHGYRARESIMHMLYEMYDWMEKYVRNAPAREKGDTPSGD